MCGGCCFGRQASSIRDSFLRRSWTSHLQGLAICCFMEMSVPGDVGKQVDGGGSVWGGGCS